MSVLAISSLLVVFLLFNGYTAESTSQNDVHLIHDVYELQDVNADLDGNYALANDIDASVTREWNNGSGFLPMGMNDPFTGRFSGNGYTISGLYIHRRETNNVGLFGSLGEGGTITELGLVNSTVKGGNNVGGLIGFNSGLNVSNNHFQGTVMGGEKVGGLVGYNYRGDVFHSSMNGEVKGNSTIGGLIGLNTGDVHRSYVTGNITGDGSRIGGLLGFNGGEVSESSANVGVNGGSYVGGLVGYNCFALVSRSFSTGVVTGASTVGGLMGWNDGTVQNTYSHADVYADRVVGGSVGINVIGVIENSYSVGEVNGERNVGGLVGVTRDGGLVKNSFWDDEVSGQGSSDGGLGVTTQEMMVSEIYIDVGWDFEGTWTIIENETYPYLTWEEQTEEMKPQEDLTYLWLLLVVFSVVILLFIVWSRSIREDS